MIPVTLFLPAELLALTYGFCVAQAEGGLICLFAVVLATIGNLSKANEQTKQIINYVYSNNGLGAYSFEFKTSDGTYRKEDGGFTNAAGKSSFTIRGEYGYFNPTGQYFSVRYIADANGFQPKLDNDETRFNDRRII